VDGMDKRRMLLIGTLMVALGVALIAWAEAVDAQESRASVPARPATATSGLMLTSWFSLVSREFATGVLADSGTSPPETVMVSATPSATISVPISSILRLSMPST